MPTALGINTGQDRGQNGSHLNVTADPVLVIVTEMRGSSRATTRLTL